jgi:DNA-binding transcriptional ArsR family regulator
VAQALADPIRREILRMLRTDVATAGAIAAAFSVSRPAVSRHLRVLREAGLVRHRERGREREYSCELSPLTELEAYLRELRAPADVWQRRFDALATEVHRTRRRRLATNAHTRKPSRAAQSALAAPRAEAALKKKEPA